MTDVLFAAGVLLWPADGLHVFFTIVLANNSNGSRRRNAAIDAGGADPRARFQL